MATNPKSLDLTIYQGRTFRHVVRWETTPVVYKQITNITQTAPPVLTVPSHGLVTGWYGAITDVVGMTEINASANSPRASDYHQVTVTDGNTLSINDIDAASFTAYSSGGYLRYNTPRDLTSAVARMDIRDRVGGTLLLALSSTDGEIVIDNTNHTITVVITDDVTALMDYKKAVYDLEIDTSDGDTSVLLTGNIAVVFEVTTSV